MKYTTLSLLVCAAMLLSNCSSNKDSKLSEKTKQSIMNGNTIMEVTTFNINANVNSNDFDARDAKVESDFTVNQPGFIKRQSGVNDKGEYVVVVFWKKLSDAEASMSKFMGDSSVADYAQMIDGPTMKMARFSMDKAFDADESQFVEVMSFDLKEGTDLIAFNLLNQNVETDFTGKRKGFLQRLTGVDEKGKQAVAVFWTNKTDSDASLNAFMADPTAKEFMQKMDQSSVIMGRYKFLNMNLTKKEKAVALLNSFNTGDQTPISYINPEKYIQHNLSVGDGLAGFGAVMQHAPPGGFKANVVRAFEDGDFVFTHTIYDFFGPKIGFDIFRFENDLIVEHWDNLIEVQAPNPSGRTQTDGAEDITEKEKTEANKATVKAFITDVLLNHEGEKTPVYINPTKYI